MEKDGASKHSSAYMTPLTMLPWPCACYAGLVPRPLFSLRERKGEKEAWDTLYVGVSTEIVNCIVKHIVNENSRKKCHGNLNWPAGHSYIAV